MDENWAILRHHVAGIFKKGHRPWSIPTRLFLVVVFIASLADVGLTLLSALIGSAELHSMWGVNRDNLYGHVLGFFPRNVLYFTIVAALLVGGVISEDNFRHLSVVFFTSNKPFRLCDDEVPLSCSNPSDDSIVDTMFVLLL